MQSTRLNDSRTAISVSPPFNCVSALRTTQMMIERRSELGAIIVINYYYVLAKNPHIITIDWHEMHYSQTLFYILFSKALHEVVCANCENDNYIRDAHLSMYKYIYLSVYTEHQPHWVSTTDETTTTPNGINWGKKSTECTCCNWYKSVFVLSHTNSIQLNWMIISSANK